MAYGMHSTTAGGPNIGKNRNVNLVDIVPLSAPRTGQMAAPELD
jgi:hypothetical protein